MRKGMSDGENWKINDEDLKSTKERTTDREVQAKMRG